MADRGVAGLGRAGDRGAALVQAVAGLAVEESRAESRRVNRSPEAHFPVSQSGAVHVRPLGWPQ